MTIVTGIFTVGTSIILMTVHTLSMKSFGAQRDALSIRLILF